MPAIIDHDARRALILERSLPLFAQKGYAGVRMRELAAELGMSTGTLYHYFPDQRSIGQQLFGQVTTLLAREAAEDFDRAGRDASTRTERFELLAAFVERNQVRLTQLLVLGLDHQRYYPEDGDATATALHTLRAVLRELMGLDDPALEELLLSSLIGGLVRRLLDPAAAGGLDLELWERLAQRQE